MDKNKIISSLALAGILTASAFGGTNVRATDADYLKPVGVYKSYKGMITDNKTIIPYLVKDLGKGVTVGDLRKEFGKGLAKVAGETNLEVLNSNKILGTGTEFVAGEVTYTLVVYGDFNGDGKIMPNDASTILNAYVNEEELTSEKKVAADITGDGKVMPNDASRILNAYVNEKIEVKTAEKEDTEKATIVLKENDVELEKDEDGKYIKYVESGTTSRLDAIVAEARDNYEGNVSYKINSDKEEVTVSETPVEVTYTVSDIAGNTETVTLKVVADSEGPEIIVKGDPIVYVKSGDTLEALKTNLNAKVTAIDKIDGPADVTFEGIEDLDLTENGEHNLVCTAVDTRGNVAESKTIKVVIDLDAPEKLADADNMVSYSTIEKTKEGVTVTITANEAISNEVEVEGEKETWDYVDDTKTAIKKVFTENTVKEGKEITIKDLAGNEANGKILISNIDRKVTGLAVSYSNGEDATPTKDDVVATISADETITIVSIESVSGEANTDNALWDDVAEESTTITFKKNGEYVVKVKDELDNLESVIVNIRGIDKTGPQIERAQYGNEDTQAKMTNQNYVVTLYADEAVSAVSDNGSVDTTKTAISSTDWAVDVQDSKKVTITVKENGTYKVTLTDVLGNESTYSFEIKNIDKDAPTFGEVVKTPETPVSSVREEKVTVVVNANEELLLTDALKEKGWTLIAGGKGIQKVFAENDAEEIELTDKAGNVSATKKTVSVTNIYGKPEINGFVQDKIKYKTVTPAFDQAKCKTAKLTMKTKELNAEGKEEEKVEEVNFTSGTVISGPTYKDGEYTLKVVDLANNESEKTFIIDNTAPVLKINDKEMTNELLTSGITLKNGDTVSAKAVDAIDGESDAEYEITAYTAAIAENQPEELPEAIVTDGTMDGVYTITVTATDEAGNQVSKDIDITVDGTAPKYEKIESTVAEDQKGKEVTVIVYFDEVLEQTGKFGTAGEGWKAVTTGVSNADKAYTRTYTKPESSKLTVYDLAGNKTEKTITVTNVDTNEITLEDIEYTYSVKETVGEEEIDKVITLNEGEKTNKDVTVEITVNKEVSKVTTGWTISEDKKSVSKKFEIANIDTLGEETVKLEDASGWTLEEKVNAKEYMDNVINAVIVERSTDEITNQAIIVTITADEAIKLPEDDDCEWRYEDEADKKVIKGSYSKAVDKTITVTDLAGNTTNASVDTTNYDKTKPVVVAVVNGEEVAVEDGKTYLFGKDVKVKVTDTNLDAANVKCNGEVWTEDKVYSDGSYVFVAPDEAGNTTTIKFAVDNAAPTIKLNEETPKTTYSKEVTISAENADIITIATITKDEAGNEVLGEATIIANNTKWETVGKFEVTARTAAGNKTTIRFEVTDGASIDVKEKYTQVDDVENDGITPKATSASKITAVKLEKYVEEERKYAEVEYMTADEIAVLTADANQVYTLKKITEAMIANEEGNYEGKYRLTVTDSFNVTKSKEFIVDVTGASITTNKVEMQDGDSYKTVTPVFEGTATLTRRDDDGDKVINNFASGTEIKGGELVSTEKETDGEPVSYTELSGDGLYTLTVTDSDANVTTINFTIDNVEPTINLLLDGTTDADYEEYKMYNSESGAVTVKSEDKDVKTLSVKKAGVELENVELDVNGVYEVTEDGAYEIFVIDNAGNKSEVLRFTIDTTVEIDADSVTYEYEAEGAHWANVTITAKEKLDLEDNLPANWSKVDDYTIRRQYNANLTENLTVYDLNGNSKQVAVNVNGIDGVAPTITSIVYTPNGAVGIDGEITVTITANEAIKEQKGLGWEYGKKADNTVDNKKLVKVFAENTEGELVPIVDLAGNKLEADYEDYAIVAGQITIVVDSIYEAVPTFDIEKSGLETLVGNKTVSIDTIINAADVVTDPTTPVSVPLASKVWGKDCKKEWIEGSTRTITKYAVTDTEMTGASETIADTSETLSIKDACIYKIEYIIKDAGNNENTLTIILKAVNE